MTGKFNFFLVLQFLLAGASAQEIPAIEPAGGGTYSMAPVDEMRPEQRSLIITMLQRNTEDLIRKGVLQPGNSNRATISNLQWPLRQAAGFSENGYFGISNYIDHNLVYPNQVVDYNCGNRSYDLASGYNHRGTDIFTWPYPWMKMTNNAVEIIAAAPGTIIGKSDGNFDQNCAFCPGACDWNAVYIQHADGTVAWYGHMKTATLTTKTVGQTVTTGEYLGVVGSSGNSTGPHLHFELWTNNSYTQLIDPWGGGCNALNGLTSSWASQEAYRIPTPISLATHSTPPANGSCPLNESMNLKLNFNPGELVYVSSYYRDNIAGQTAVHRLYRPDNSLWVTWNQIFGTTFNASWWYYSWTLPTTGSVNGVWRYEVTYNSQTVTANFGINTTLPLTLISFAGKNSGGKAELTWETEEELNIEGFIVECSLDGTSFSRQLPKVNGKNSGGRNRYTTVDEKPCRGNNYYRLKILDKNGSVRYSQVIKIEFRDAKLQIVVGPVPFKNQLSINIAGEFDKIRLSVFNSSGQVVNTRELSSTQGTTILNTSNLPAGVYVITIEENNQVVERKKLLKVD
jgi:murein DD-endopeptidase MepM/ murein hydrolase activator NlpD